ncbi:DUF1517 domain-containing protein [Phormidium tenue FACHB-886]|nr:DUF1517 domain-containing protein [Phormidium tenue FACHB-886]
MGTFAKLRSFGATALALALVNALGLEIQPVHQAGGLEAQLVLQGDRTEARTSGGRSRGGSFSRPSSPSRSDPSYSNPAPSYNNDPYYPRSAPVPVPIPAPGYGYGYGGGGGGLGLLLLLLLGGGSILPIVLFYLMRSRISAGGQGYGGYTNGYSNGYNGGHSNGGYSNGYDGYDSYGYTGNREIDNDTVTVTRLQVALLSQARHIQDSLTEYTLNADTDTTEGLTELLQESVLALLRSPENWSHVRVNSQTVKSREQATQLFEQISIEERSKFSAETLANVGGRVRRQAMPKNEDDAPASYIVVTLVLGTADDRPLFDEKIRTTQELQAALQRLGSITPEYLLVFELLWSPQDASDSLTYDELLTEYPGLIQI